MEGKKYFIGLVFLTSFLFANPFSGFSQENHKKQIYEAYSKGEMDKWLEVMRSFETSTVKNRSLEQSLELVNYLYGYTGWLISVEKYESAEDYIEKSEYILDKLYADDQKNATVLAYKGAFIAYQIGIASYKAIYLGRTSLGYIEDALEIDSNNIQAHIEMGNAKYYCPAAFGGDKKGAIRHYIKAASLMEKEKLTSQNWMYLNVMTAVGMAYEEIEQIHDAKLCYEKIIGINPDFIWVGKELYPDLLKRHNL